ncbi:hypothetical protein OIE66_09105 [Nonomuraea sp. NBC_01738]|uniref:hypothetical protein n=1 Tax=Nonomuraea sp. NBC_01738 TaxID=2976003 RepID=UPI002E0E4A38|nr:hypothetical protein OIE66_09105 [Nonomuraea sp. NBC_01738]
MSIMRERAGCGAALEDSLAEAERALHAEGDLRSARHWFEAAYRDAECLRDGVTMARSALGMSGVWVHEHRTDAEAETIESRQRHALTLVHPRSSLALRLRARLLGEQDYRAGRHAAILAMAGEARAHGDPVTLAETLSLAHHCLLGPDHVRLRKELSEELIGQAAATGRRGDLLMGVMWRTVDLFLAGDPHAERSLHELRGLLRQGDHLAAGFVLSAIDVMLAIRAGRFDEAEDLAAVCVERGTEAGDIDATGWYGGQIGAIRWYQGRIGELLPVLSEMVGSATLSAVDHSYVAALAGAAAATGDRDLAESTLAKLGDLAELPRSSTWLLTLFSVVEAAHLLGDRDLSARAHALLLPFERLPMIASLGVVCFGSVRHALGMACLTMGDTAQAAAHLEAAVRDNLALGHWPAVALSRWRLGHALAQSHGPGHQGARKELAQAMRDADDLGLPCPPRLPAPTSPVRPAVRDGSSPGAPGTASSGGSSWAAGRCWSSRASACATWPRCWPTRDARSAPPSSPPTWSSRDRWTRRPDGPTGSGSPSSRRTSTSWPR